MKQTIQATGTPVPVSVRAGKFFSWRNVAKVFNVLPFGVCECESVDDAKGYVKALILLIFAFLIARMEKGGAQ